MIKWHETAVADFLRCKPQRTSSQSPTLTFTFFAGSSIATLSVSPAADHVALTIAADLNAKPFAAWMIERCPAILVNRDIPEEGGDCLVIQAQLSDARECMVRRENRWLKPLHWILVSPTADFFTINSFFTYS